MNTFTMQADDVIFPIRNLKMAEGKEQSLHRVLQSVVLLDNGEYGYVYRDLGIYKNEKKYMCNVCKRVLIFSKSVLSHNVHPTHRTNIKIPMHNSANFPEITSKIPRDCPTPSDDELDGSDDNSKSKEDVNVKPGEPVPPGVDDALDLERCQIQTTFDNFTSGPLIGLEYIVELVSVEEHDAEPRYICLLCEKKGDPRSVMVHVTSYNHYLKYICCFFRTVGNKLNLIPKCNANRSAINTAIIKVAEAIEKHFGRLKPIKTAMETFANKKFQILREIDEKEHFRETPQITFLDFVTPEKLEEYAKAPVVNYNTRDLDAKNEEMTKKCLENNQKLATNKSLDKKSEKSDSKTNSKSQDNNGGEGKKISSQREKPDPLGIQTPPKKLCIALNKPARSIPGISKPQVQNLDIIVKDENDETVVGENETEVIGDEKDDKDDDCIILADSKKDPIEIHSLSSVSSRSRSWSRSRFPHHRGRSRSPRQRKARRSRSRDRFGRMKRDSRETSYERYRRERDLPLRDRDRDRRDDRSRRDLDDRGRRDLDDRGKRDLDDRSRRDLDERGRRDVDDRGKRDLDERGRRDYDERRRRDLDDRARRDEPRNHRSMSRGRAPDTRRDRGYRADSRGRRGDSRDRRNDSRERYDDRNRYDDKRKIDDRRDYGDKERRDRIRNPTPDRYREDLTSRRDRNHESEDRTNLISEEIKKRNRWHAYKEELVKLEDDLDKTYKFYQGHPEKHPSYNEEWKAFWNRRYKEIQMSGQDPAKYDFKPEWILFWEKKMKEIHEQKVINEKETLKRKHNLDDLQDIRGDRDLQDISPPTPENAKEVTVNDIKKTWKTLTGSEITAPKRSNSPWEPKYKEKHPQDVGMTSQQFFAPVKRSNSGVAPAPPVIHCLRMLSVLEQQIGFQASRVISLLSQALAMEKTKTNHSMTLLQNKDIYLFFEAMKEKLRGQLMAGIVQRHLVSATRNVIKTVEGMLETNPLEPEMFQPVTIPGVGDVDKVAVAQKIAGALIKMGKTNVSQEELEQLINAVVGMASASSISADVSSDKFFAQLNIKNSNASSHINSIISSLIQTAQQSVSSDVPRIEAVVEPPVIEQREPPRFVNYDDSDVEEPKGNTERGPSPFSMRSGGINPIKERYDEKKEEGIVAYDDDDDDYSFEDVYHAASEKLKKSEENKTLSTGDENSQTQSSIASVPLKNVTDILSSVDTSALSNLAIFSNQKTSEGPPSVIQPEITNAVNDISKTLNLNELKSFLSQTQPVEKPGIDMSLVASIKDTLVQSFSQNNLQHQPTDSFSNFSVSDNRPRERPTLDPRSRSVWDPSIKALENRAVESRVGTAQWDDPASRPPIWEEKVWDSRSRDARQWTDGNGRGPWDEQNNWGSQPSGPWEPGYGPQYGRPPPFNPNDGHPPPPTFGRPNAPYPYQDPNLRNRPPFY